MSKVLMRRIEYWRVDTETEAEEVIGEASGASGELTKKSIELKQKKSKGQVVAENLKVTTQVDFAGQWPTDEEEFE